jgi:hypothetical protein
MQQAGANQGYQDTLINSEIARASLAIHRYCEREFVTTATNPATRTFELMPQTRFEGWVSLAPYDLQAVSGANPVKIDTDQTSAVNLGVDEWRYWPQPAADGVYMALRLQPLSINTGRIPWVFRQVSVTGNWGFPSIPADVEHACIVTAVTWLRRDVSVFSNTMVLDEQRVERPQTIPGGVRHILDLYKREAVS